MPDFLTTRAAHLVVRGGPSSLDEANRAVEIIAATEAPTDAFDIERWETVPEVLLMSGFEAPSNGVRLLDSHSYYTTASVRGSVDGFRVEGDKLIALARVSRAQDSENDWIKIKEGHLTDVSSGYQILAAVWVEEGTTATVEGRQFTGPVRVVTRWKIYEVSLCPIGADEAAQVRAAQKEVHMPTKPKDNQKATGAPGQPPAAAPDAARSQHRTDPPPAPPEDSAAPDGGQPPEDGAPEGGQAPATDPPANAQRSRQAPASAPEEIAAQARRDERDRITSVRAMVERFRLPDDFAGELINSDLSLDACRSRIMERALETQAGGMGHRTPQVLADETDKYRAAAAHGIMARAGFTPREPAAGYQDFMGHSLRRLCREALRRSGHTPPEAPYDLVRRAFASSDLPIILGNTANLSLQQGYETAEETWQLWCDQDTLPDFNPRTIARASGFGILRPVREGGEYKSHNLMEKAEEVKLSKYGERFWVTWEAMISDHVGLFTRVPFLHGQAAARTVGNLPYAVLTSNPKMKDGKALFHSDHKNLAASGAAPGQASIGAAITAIALQKDLKGNVLRLRPKFFIAPQTLETQAEAYFKTIRIANEDGSLIESQHGGSTFQRIYEPRLDAASTTAWYMAAPKGSHVCVFFLAGQERPYLATKDGWNVDGTEFKVRQVAAAAPTDTVGIHKNPGA